MPNPHLERLLAEARMGTALSVTTIEEARRRLEDTETNKIPDLQTRADEAREKVLNLVNQIEDLECDALLNEPDDSDLEEQEEDEKLTELRFQVQDTGDALSDLTSQLEKLSDEVRLLKSLLAPIRRLPPEILVYIFTHACAGEPRTSLSRPVSGAETSTATRLSRVCSRWRRIALDASTLWASSDVVDTLATSPDVPHEHDKDDPFEESVDEGPFRVITVTDPKPRDPEEPWDEPYLPSTGSAPAKKSKKRGSDSGTPDSRKGGKRERTKIPSPETTE